jgi:hypothetical protein
MDVEIGPEAPQIGLQEIGPGVEPDEKQQKGGPVAAHRGDDGGRAGEREEESEERAQELR